jgi:hypothetical protein
LTVVVVGGGEGAGGAEGGSAVLVDAGVAPMSDTVASHASGP